MRLSVCSPTTVDTTSPVSAQILSYLISILPLVIIKPFIQGEKINERAQTERVKVKKQKHSPYTLLYQNVILDIVVLLKFNMAMENTKF